MIFTDVANLEGKIWGGNISNNYVNVEVNVLIANLSKDYGTVVYKIRK